MSRTAQTVGCDFYAIGADKLRVGTSNSLALEFVFAILGSHSLSCSILESPDPLQVGTFFFATSECDFCAIGARKVGAAGVGVGFLYAGRFLLRRVCGET
jgi:hypothetical protein